MRSRHQLLSQPSRIGSQGDHVLNVCDVGVEIGVLADMASVAKPRQSGCRGGNPQHEAGWQLRANPSVMPRACDQDIRPHRYFLLNGRNN
jgi:hypothetical protein